MKPHRALGSDRSKMIAKVHIAKKELAYDDELYRAVLLRVTGAESSRDLTNEQLVALLSEFRRLGWEPKSSTGKRLSSKPQVRKLWALWAEMGREGIVDSPSRNALRSYIFNRTGVSDPEWLNDAEARSIIRGLKAWQRDRRRKARDRASNDGGAQ